MEICDQGMQAKQRQSGAGTRHQLGDDDEVVHYIVDKY